MSAEDLVPATVEAYNVRDLQRGIARVAGRLERLAEDVRRYGDAVARVGQQGHYPTYGRISGDITHEIMTALMNLSLDSLSAYAAEADVARAKGE